MYTEDETKKVYRVPDFCEAHQITRQTLVALWKEGRGPKIIRLSAGKKAQILIPVEAAESWRLSLLVDYRGDQAA